MPDESETAAMIRADLAAARAAWLKAASKDTAERLRREQSDFLLAENHEGQVLDFHSLRHTCGAWLAQAGVNPKAIQTIMHHSTITLTMDTYGHLMPGQEADAIARMPAILEGGKQKRQRQRQRALCRGVPLLQLNCTTNRARRSHENHFFPRENGTFCPSVPLYS